MFLDVSFRSLHLAYIHVVLRLYWRQNRSVGVFRAEDVPLRLIVFSFNT